MYTSINYTCNRNSKFKILCNLYCFNSNNFNTEYSQQKPYRSHIKCMIIMIYQNPEDKLNTKEQDKGNHKVN